MRWQLARASTMFRAGVAGRGVARNPAGVGARAAAVGVDDSDAVTEFVGPGGASCHSVMKG